MNTPMPGKLWIKIQRVKLQSTRDVLPPLVRREIFENENLQL